MTTSVPLDAPPADADTVLAHQSIGQARAAADRVPAVLDLLDELRDVTAQMNEIKARAWAAIKTLPAYDLEEPWEAQGRHATTDELRIPNLFMRALDGDEQADLEHLAKIDAIRAAVARYGSNAAADADTLEQTLAAAADALDPVEAARNRLAAILTPDQLEEAVAEARSREENKGMGLAFALDNVREDVEKGTWHGEPAVYLPHWLADAHDVLDGRRQRVDAEFDLVDSLGRAVIAARTRIGG